MSLQSYLEKSHKSIVSNAWLTLFTAIASGFSGLLAFGLVFTALGIVGNHNILYPILFAVGSLAISIYLLSKYRSKYVLK